MNLRQISIIFNYLLQRFIRITSCYGVSSHQSTVNDTKKFVSLGIKFHFVIQKNKGRIIISHMGARSADL